MKKNFFAGLIILLPIVLTLIILIFVLDLLTNPFFLLVNHFFLTLNSPLAHHPLLVTFISRLLILASLVLFIFILGVLGRWFFFSILVEWGHVIVSKIPFINTIYKILKEIIAAIFPGKARKVFQKSVLVHFPYEGSYCLGFLCGEMPEKFQKEFKEPYVAVLLPTAPHPISGYYCFVPASLVLPVDMTNEDTIKFAVSCGVVLPEAKP